MNTPTTPTASRQTPVKTANERPKNGPSPSHHGPMHHAIEKSVNFGPSLRRLLGYLKPQRLWLTFVVIMGTLSVAFTVVNPTILGRATDVIFTGIIGKTLPIGTPKAVVVDQLRSSGHETFADLVSSLNLIPGQGIDFSQLSKILIFALLLYLVSSLFLYGQGRLLNRAVQHSVYDLREQVRTKLDSLPLSYFDQQPRGELLSRVTNDIDNISQTLQQTLSQLLNAVLMLIGVAIMMISANWQLALISFLIIPASGIISTIIGKRAQKRFATMWKTTGELNAQIEEAFTGHALVKVFGRKAEVEDSFADTNEKLFTAAFKGHFISGLIMPVNTFIGNLNYTVIAVLGGLKVASGSLALGSVQAFLQYSRMFTHPLVQIASMTNLLQSGVASAERVFEVLDAPQEQPDEHQKLPDQVAGHVQFNDIVFRYVDGKDLIDKLSLEALPGQSIAIVGPTGAGKTTLVNLLERFYDLRGGAITLDGIDISSVSRSDLRSKLGMVLQDTWLFGGTIRDNIAYGKIGASEDEILAAAKAAYVDRFVHMLPHGYDTVINDEESNISAGEKQLLTIARAFIADPAVLILDEATSSVDTRTEVLVQQAMAALRTGRTSFVIAHRLSTIRGADLILVMNDGAIVEQGNHDELLAAKGAYYELYQSQFAAAIAEEVAV